MAQVVAIRRPGDDSGFRRTAEQMARRLGFPTHRMHEAGLVALELATNLLRHATAGVAIAQANDGALELVGIDSGPGIRDPELFLDGHTTAGSMGAGIGSMQRMSQHFEVDTGPQGTVVLSRMYADHEPHAPPVVGAVALALGLETPCGDAWTYRQVADGVQILAVDGAGHGEAARIAAQRAIDAFHQMPESSPVRLLEHLHKELAGTRGAAVTIATAGRDVRFAGIGNVDGRWLSNRRRGVAARPGTVGNYLGVFRPAEETLPGPGRLVLCSDGLDSRWGEAVTPELFEMDPTLAAGTLIRDFRRGTDDALALVCTPRLAE